MTMGHSERTQTMMDSSKGTAVGGGRDDRERSTGEFCVSRIHAGELRMDVLTDAGTGVARRQGDGQDASGEAAYRAFLRNSTGSALLSLTGESYAG